MASPVIATAPAALAVGKAGSASCYPRKMAGNLGDIWAKRSSLLEEMRSNRRKSQG
jgi:hypothetical protein